MVRFYLILYFLFNTITYLNSKEQIYYCPMHPSYTSTKPRQCPICGMDLVLREEENKEEKTHLKHIVGDSHSTIKVSSDFLRKFGIKTFKVIEKEFSINLFLPGNVAYDKELYELLNEYKNANLIIGNDGIRTKDIVASSLLKLKAYGINEESANNIITIGIEPLISPSNITYAYFYADEKYNGLIKEDDEVIIKMQNTDKNFIGKVLIVSGLVDENRKIKIIVLVKDEDFIFIPQTYLYGEFKINRGKKLLIPDDSYIENGDEDIVYIQKEENKYEIRKIKTGFSSNDYTEVLTGLKAGEKIVSPAFLIDSEARLKGMRDEAKSKKQETHIHNH